MSISQQEPENVIAMAQKPRKGRLKKAGLMLLVLSTVLSMGIGLGAYGRTLNIQDELHLGIAYTPREENNLFAPPPDMEDFIWDISNSLVEINCTYGDKTDVGTGFAIDLSRSLKLASGFKSHVVSNNHVIEDCIANDGAVSMALGPDYKKIVTPELIDVDFDNDLALFLVKEEVTPLYTASYFSTQGEWNMVIGNPLSIETNEILHNATTFGYTIAVEEEKYNFTSATINPGNSGGPLVNSRGELIGITTSAGASTDFGVHNIAMDSDLLCRKIIKCD